MNATLPRGARTLLTAALTAVALSALAPTPAQAQAKAKAKPKAQTHLNNYPTADRVLFVEACMALHPGPRFEMLSKCSCTLDSVATKMPFAEFESAATATNAFSIGGERGGYIRDTAVLNDEIKRFKEVQKVAKTGCFINVEAK